MTDLHSTRYTIPSARVHSLGPDQQAHFPPKQERCSVRCSDPGGSESWGLLAYSNQPKGRSKTIKVGMEI